MKINNLQNQTTKYLAASLLFNQRNVQAEQLSKYNSPQKSSHIKDVIGYSYDQGLIPELFEGDAKEAIETRNPRYAYLVYQTLLDYFMVRVEYLAYIKK